MTLDMCSARCNARKSSCKASLLVDGVLLCAVQTHELPEPLRQPWGVDVITNLI